MLLNLYIQRGDEDGLDVAVGALEKRVFAHAIEIYIRIRRLLWNAPFGAHDLEVAILAHLERSNLRVIACELRTLLFKRI